MRFHFSRLQVTSLLLLTILSLCLMGCEDKPPGYEHKPPPAGGPKAGGPQGNGKHPPGEVSNAATR